MMIGRDLYNHKDESIEKSKQQFLELQRGLIREPLRTPEEFDKFYEPILDDKRLISFLKKVHNRDKPGKYFLTGHRGVGKTTVINRISQLSRNFFCVVTGSVKDLMPDTDPDYRDVLLLISFLLTEKVIQLSYIHPGVEILPLIRDLCSIVGVKNEADLPSVILVYFTQFQARLRLEEAFRGQIRTRIEKKLSELLNCIDQMRAEIEYYSKKPLLMIIDDLDKIDTNIGLVNPTDSPAQLPVDAALFYKYRAPICEPRFHIIYTLPFSLYYSDFFIRLQHYYHDVLVVPVVNVIRKDHAENEKGVQELKKLAAKRIPAALFTGDVLADLVYMSGGNISDIICLLYRCCGDVVGNPKINKYIGMTRRARNQIDAAALKNAADGLKTDMYRLLSNDKRSQLRKLSQTHEPGSIKPENLNFFIRENLIFEQRTPDIWFLVHPLLWAAIGIENEFG